VNTEKQSIHVAKNIALVLKGAQPLKYKVDEKGMFKSATAIIKE